MSYKVLTDGNGSGLIRVVGMGEFMPLSQHQAMIKECEYKSAQLFEVMAERDALIARIQTAERVEKLIGEAPELTFDDCKRLFSAEIAEIKAMAIEEAIGECLSAIDDTAAIKLVPFGYLLSEKWLLHYAEKIRRGDK